MVDYIGYTLYSDRAKFDRYLSSLRNALARKVKVQLLVKQRIQIYQTVSKVLPYYRSELPTPSKLPQDNFCRTRRSRSGSKRVAPS
jgi:hypothetical protein